MKYYSVIRKNDVLIHATTWMDLKNIMLSQRTQKVTYYMVWFIINIQNRYICRDRKQISG